MYSKANQPSYRSVQSKCVKTFIIPQLEFSEMFCPSFQFATQTIMPLLSP